MAGRHRHARVAAVPQPRRVRRRPEEVEPPGRVVAHRCLSGLEAAGVPGVKRGVQSGVDVRLRSQALAAGLEADAPLSKKGGVLGFLARKKRRSDPVPLPSAERRSARARTPKVIVDAPSEGGPGVAAPAPSAEELKLREELESLKRENTKLKKPASLCAEDASLLDALL